jgi:hypothetical protein
MSTIISSPTTAKTLVPDAVMKQCRNFYDMYPPENVGSFSLPIKNYKGNWFFEFYVYSLKTSRRFWFKESGIPLYCQRTYRTDGMCQEEELFRRTTFSNKLNLKKELENNQNESESGRESEMEKIKKRLQKKLESRKTH